MDNLNLPPFYVGQKVVCVEGHDWGVFKKGDIFKVLNLKRTECKCGYWTVDIGVKIHYPILRCYHCNEETPNDNHFACARFRPLQQQKFPLITLKKVAEQELCAS